MSIDKLPKFTEFECKYRVEEKVLETFMEAVAWTTDGPIHDRPLNEYHVTGPDTFFVKDEGSFGRYRQSDQQIDKNENHFAQWTIKEKREGAKNSVIRFESNWTVSGTPEEEVIAGAIAMGYKVVGKIHKDCHICRYNDATIVFYTVVGHKSDKKAHFIEIEVDEKTIDQLTEEEAWGVIEKYENLLKKTGINAKKRLKLSLFDMYREDL